MYYFKLGQRQPEQHSDIEQHLNMDLTSIITPVNPTVLKELLVNSQYDEKEIDFLVDGFSNGFDIGYEGPNNR